MIVADGLLAFLAPDDMVSLLNRLISHFPSGEVAFNGYSNFAIWAANAITAPNPSQAWLGLPARRPARARALGPPPDAGQGSPAHARTRGRRFPACPSPVHPPGSTQRSPVPERTTVRSTASSPPSRRPSPADMEIVSMGDPAGPRVLP